MIAVVLYNHGMGYDVAVIGAGVFGVWTAYALNRAGKSVLLLDAYGPGNSRASSGGESRIMRLGYGPDEIYTRSAQRSPATSATNAESRIMRLGYGPDEIYTRSAQRSLQMWQEVFAE